MKALSKQKWFYPLVYSMLVIFAVWPPYTEIPFDPRRTQAVIMDILMRSTQPYAASGWIFHMVTLGVVALAIFRPQLGGRAIAAYFGLNYLVVAALQTHAVTEDFGFAVQTGALIASSLLGVLWLWVAWKDQLQISFKNVPVWRWILLPFALLVFWSPIGMEGNRVVFDFNPLYLLTSPDYGLAYCFMTPVLLFLLLLAWPQVNGFALRVTAFNALLYGLFNLSHWFRPDLVMGAMHLPLLLLALVLLWMPRFSPKKLVMKSAEQVILSESDRLYH
jgi:hypothetical protein